MNAFLYRRDLNKKRILSNFQNKKKTIGGEKRERREKKKREIKFHN
jgi:hypothetical protein